MELSHAKRAQGVAEGAGVLPVILLSQELTTPAPEATADESLAPVSVPRTNDTASDEFLTIPQAVNGISDFEVTLAPARTGIGTAVEKISTDPRDRFGKLCASIGAYVRVRFFVVQETQLVIGMQFNAFHLDDGHFSPVSDIAPSKQHRSKQEDGLFMHRRTATLLGRLMGYHDTLSVIVSRAFHGVRESRGFLQIPGGRGCPATR